MLTRPARDVDPDRVVEAVEHGMRLTGYNEFSLLSLSCSDYLSLPSVGIQIKNRLQVTVGAVGVVGSGSALLRKAPHPHRAGTGPSPCRRGTVHWLGCACHCHWGRPALQSWSAGRLMLGSADAAAGGEREPLSAQPTGGSLRRQHRPHHHEQRQTQVAEGSPQKSD